MEKLAEIFLNTFNRISFSIYDAVKSYCEKLVLKTYQLEFSGLSILLYGVISLSDATSYEKFSIPSLTSTANEKSKLIINQNRLVDES